MKLSHLRLYAAMILFGAFSGGAAATERAANAPLTCDESIKTAFKPDEWTTVLLVKAFKRGDPLLLSGTPTELTPKAPNDLCLVKLNVGPGNPGPSDLPSTSPGIGIEVWLPTPSNWNGRVHALGGGSWAGGRHKWLTAIGWPLAALTAGTQGAVSSHTDTGHEQQSGAWVLNPNGKTNTALWNDFAGRSLHEQAVKTKALATAFYGRPPRYSYFSGSSTGGRQGYKLAQAYPDDYDGIVANLPALNWPQFTIAGLYRRLLVLKELRGVPLTEGQQDLVSNAAIRACDVVGGQHLGYIMDPAACRYDPTKDADVLCVDHGGKNATADCVTRLQANVINKIWYGPTSDGTVPSPVLDNGASTDLQRRKWYGPMRGTSLYAAYFTKLESALQRSMRARPAEPSVPEAGAGSRDPRTGRASAGDGLANSAAATLAAVLENPVLGGSEIRTSVGNGQGLWTRMSYKDLAEAVDRSWQAGDRLGGVASDDPDLSAFKRGGGKFLSWHGWNDEVIPVQGTMRYYDSVIKRMGGLANVQSFFKLYLIPGGGHTSPHGTSNPDANPPGMGDALYPLLVDWVEKGIAPDRIEIQSRSTERPVITQPACPYPQKASYMGGDPRETTSYACV